MPDYNILESKTEEAFAVVIAAYAGALAGTIFLSQSADELSVPSTEINATLGPEVQQGTGIRWVFVTVTVRSSADKGHAADGYTETDPVPDHQARVAKVRDGCLQDTVVDLLNAAGIAELTVVDVFNDGAAPNSHGKDTEGRWLEDAMVLRVVAAAAAI